MESLEGIVQEFQRSLSHSEVYHPGDVPKLCEYLENHILTTKFKKVHYLEFPASFDIEASSFYDDQGRKCATMYVWSLGIMGRVIIGRTWEEFVYTLNTISINLMLSEEKRLVVYVHNIDYDFQFFRKWLTWTHVFSIDDRKPLYAISDIGIEFRCSYKLSGYSLETVGKNLKRFQIRKLAGDLDYSVKRHSRTPLTAQELQYVINDSLVVMAYIMECMIEEGTITKIPLTKTGYVRRFVREACFGKTKESKLEYHQFISGLRISSVDEYHQLKRAFQGGFTHASPFFVNKTVTDGNSEDITSSYPTTIVAEGGFPMSSAQIVHIKSMEEFEENLRSYCCLFDIEFFGIESTFLFDNYLSSSRCYGLQGEVISNGRVVRADHLITTITEQDYFIIRKCYRWAGNPRIGTFRRYKRGYLPTPLVNAVLELYKDKTELKGVPGREEEYNRKKEMINSCYGMAVTDPIREEIVYDANTWPSERRKQGEKKKRVSKDTIQAEIKKYNNSFSRFLFYPWGVWITAFARRNLWTAIFHLQDDYIYSDTDSVKYRNAEKHKSFFEQYNQIITGDIRKACEYHHIDPAKACPLTIKGKPKPLGVWDFDGQYSRFKTLGAKRYLVEYSDESENGEEAGHIRITVAGVNKTKGAQYLTQGWAFTRDHQEVNSPFDKFSNQLEVPPEFTGKLTHTYIDREINTTLTDFLGNTTPIHELSVVHMEPTGYSLTMASSFLAYIQEIKIQYI